MFAGVRNVVDAFPTTCQVFSFIPTGNTNAATIITNRSVWVSIGIGESAVFGAMTPMFSL